MINHLAYKTVKDNEKVCCVEITYLDYVQIIKSQSVTSLQ